MTVPTRIPVMRDIMAKKLITVSPDTPIQEAIDKLLRHNISGAPVVDEPKHLVGMLSERDCLCVLANAAFNRLPHGRVRDYMSPVHITIGPEEGLFMVADLFLRLPYRRIPVVEDGQLVGQVSRRDVLRGAKEFMKAVEARPDTKIASFLTDEIRARLG